jgi:hypothetical protein
MMVVVVVAVVTVAGVVVIAQDEIKKIFHTWLSINLVGPSCVKLEYCSKNIDRAAKLELRLSTRGMLVTAYL